MTAVQTQASKQFLAAKGPMIEDEQKMNAVLEYIESIKIQSLRKQITLEELDQRGMPLHQAMDKLREKAREYYQA